MQSTAKISANRRAAVQHDDFSSFNNDFRELKQRERHKFAYLVGKNNSFACPARAFFIFVHFFAVVCKKTTWDSQIWGFMKNVSTWG